MAPLSFSGLSTIEVEGVVGVRWASMYDDALEVRHAAEALLYRYATCLDDGPLEHWPRCFTDAGQYRLIPRENLQQKIREASRV